MGCPSVEEHNRILNLRSWRFKSFVIVADEWIPAAERSNILAQKRCCWIQVFGIPLHLRSQDLIRAIGNSCGTFLESNISNWFNDGVRIKIYIQEEIPDDVRI
ncbi:hypothetical protein LINGRAPRIM_LOCUS3292 [Linum grandiflorum]